MVSDPRLAALRSSERYELTTEDLDNDVYAIATPKTAGYDFSDPQDAKFNLSEHIGIVDNALVWGGSGFEKHIIKHGIWVIPSTKERWLEVTLKDPEEDTLAGAHGEQEDDGQGHHAPAVPQADSHTLVLNLDNYLDIVEEFEPVSREVRLKLGLKPERSKRSIILCFDGTSNHFSSQNTNVVKLVELLKKDDPLQQLVYYQAGVGTYSPPGYLSSLNLKVAALVDEGIAWFLYHHVIDGYKYLMETYRAGDQISIFGFSRGAYTARALAGMLHSVGLLSKHNIEQVPFAYQIYASGEVSPEENTRIVAALDHLPPAKEDQSGLDRLLGKVVDLGAHPDYVNPEHFKSVFCTPVQITFLGIWDTVGSIGALTTTHLPWIEYNPSVKYFRQALALDENRGNFIPSLWDHMRPRTSDLEQPDAREVWFKGGHTDVGGGAPPSPPSMVGKYPNPERLPDLSHISLRWMVRQCLSCHGVRVLFDPDSMRRYRKVAILEDRLSQKRLDEIEAQVEKERDKIRDAAEARFKDRPMLQSQDKRDAQIKAEIDQKIKERIQEEINEDIERRIAKLDSFDITPSPYLALNAKPFWWILEIIPLPKLSQLRTTSPQPQSSWAAQLGAPLRWILDRLSTPQLTQRKPKYTGPGTAWRPNMGAARIVDYQQNAYGVRIHTSVHEYINQPDTEKGKGYEPSVKWWNWGPKKLPYVEGGNIDGPMTREKSAKVMGVLSKLKEPNQDGENRAGTSKTPVILAIGAIFVAGTVLIAADGRLDTRLRY